MSSGSSSESSEDEYHVDQKRQRLRNLLGFCDADDDTGDMGLSDTFLAKVQKPRNHSGSRFYNIDPRHSWWFKVYIESPSLENDKFLFAFRWRFRIPYQCFLELSSELENSASFARWHKGSKNFRGKAAAPLPLLLLTALRYLGRSWTLDDLSEATGVSEEVIRCFLHFFISVLLFYTKDLLSCQ